MKKTNLIPYLMWAAFAVAPLTSSAFSLASFFNFNTTTSAATQTSEKSENLQNLKVFAPNKAYAQPVATSDQTSTNSFEVKDDLVDNLGTSQEGNSENSVYTVQKGDSIYSIADYFGVSSKTIMDFNHKAIITVHAGDVLEIPPTSGVVYTIQKGDTLNSISKKYNVDVSEIALYGGFQLTDDLTVGDEILLPGAKDLEEDKDTKKKTTKGKTGTIKITIGTGKSKGRQWANGDTEHLNTSSDVVKYSSLPKYVGYYMMPAPGATRTQKMHGHNGVDLANRLGSPILAAADGVVRVAKTGGYNYGYGNYIIVTHSNGTETLYGHLLQVNVSVGQSVSKGQQIALLGSTGNSTGPHVHFEIRGAYNPWAW